MLAQSDLRTDPILVRKIRRIQKSRQAEEEEDGLASSPPRRTSANRAESVASDSDGEDIDAMERRTQQPKTVKNEPKSSRPAPSTAQVVDLGGDSDADEDDDDVTDEE